MFVQNAMAISVVNSNAGRREIEQFFAQHLPWANTIRIPSPRQQHEERSLIYAMKVVDNGTTVAALYAETPRSVLSDLRNIPGANPRALRRIVSLERIAVHPDHQHRGIGESLVREFESLASSDGVSQIFGQTADGEKFFQKCGYTICSSPDDRLVLALVVESRRAAKSFPVFLEFKCLSRGERFFRKQVFGDSDVEDLAQLHQPTFEELDAIVSNTLTICNRLNNTTDSPHLNS